MTKKYMRQRLIVENEICPNCTQQYSGSHCSYCGQKAIDNIDRSIATLAGGFFGNIFFLDNRFVISLKYLIGKPGRMTVEFLDGKRKKFLPPVTLFLFINLIYFILTPLTDYSLPLGDQVSLQFYSGTANSLVESRLEERAISFDKYAFEYNKASDNISKTVMILNVPLFALFVFLFSFSKRPFFFDSLIFSLHFYSFFLTGIIVGDLLSKGLAPLFDFDWLLVFILIIPGFYLIISFRRFTRAKWWYVIGASILLILGLGLSQFVYRGIIFYLTFLST